MTSEESALTRDVVPIFLGALFAMLSLGFLAFLIGDLLLIEHFLFGTPFAIISFLLLIIAGGMIRGAENFLIAANGDAGDLLAGCVILFTAYNLLVWFVILPYLAMIFFGSPRDIPTYAESLDFISRLSIETVWGLLWFLPILFVSILGTYSASKRTKDEQLTTSKIRYTLQGVGRFVFGLPRALGNSLRKFWVPIVYFLILMLATFAGPLVLDLSSRMLLPLVLAVGGAPIVSGFTMARYGRVGTSLLVGLVPAVWLTSFGIVQWYTEFTSSTWSATVRAKPSLIDYLPLDILPWLVGIGLGGAIVGIVIGLGYRWLFGAPGEEQRDTISNQQTE